MIERFQTKIDVIFLSYVTSLSESADDLLVLDFRRDVFLDFSGEDDQVRSTESFRHLAVLNDDVQICCFEPGLGQSCGPADLAAAGDAGAPQSRALLRR